MYDALRVSLIRRAIFCKFTLMVINMPFKARVEVEMGLFFFNIYIYNLEGFRQDHLSSMPTYITGISSFPTSSYHTCRSTPLCQLSAPTSTQVICNNTTRCWMFNAECICHTLQHDLRCCYVLKRVISLPLSLSNLLVAISTLNLTICSHINKNI